MNKVWVMSQDGEKLVLAEQFEIHSAMEGAVIYVNCSLAGRYRSKERAMDVLAEIEDQLRRGNCFDDMYQHSRVSKQNVYHFPKE